MTSGPPNRRPGKRVSNRYPCRFRRRTDPLGKPGLMDSLRGRHNPAGIFPPDRFRRGTIIIVAATREASACGKSYPGYMKYHPRSSRVDGTVSPNIATGQGNRSHFDSWQAPSRQVLPGGQSESARQRGGTEQSPSAGTHCDALPNGQQTEPGGQASSLAAIESTRAARQAKICRAPALVGLFAALAQTLARQAASV